MGSQGAPNPPGNSNTFNYPQPQGYAGAQASQAPPRGYQPGNTPTPVYTPPYPQYPVTPGSPASRGFLPTSVLNAVRLMYAGAAYSFLYAIGVIVATAAIIKNHPLLVTSRTGAASRVTVGEVAFFAVIEAIIVIALWLWLASACKRGKGWARITGTVLFGIHTIGMLGVITSPHRDLGLVKVLTLIGWLIAGAAVVFLWRRESGAYFSGRGVRPARRGDRPGRPRRPGGGTRLSSPAGRLTFATMQEFPASPPCFTMDGGSG